MPARRELDCYLSALVRPMNKVKLSSMMTVWINAQSNREHLFGCVCSSVLVCASLLYCMLVVLTYWTNLAKCCLDKYAQRAIL